MKLLAVMWIVLVGCADERVLSGPCVGHDCTAHVHPTGILDPSSPDFHGAELMRLDWNFPLCGKCHGDDFTGGKAGVSCVRCHVGGPQACTTCHGTGPTSNAHHVHAGTGITCSSCHEVPASWDADGHILHDGVAITTPPKVAFTPTGTWDGTTCTNVYCHGATLHGGTVTSPRWSDPTQPGPDTCGRCHGAPPPSHARADCATCHPPTAPHVDGIVQIGRTNDCSGCHGSPGSPAPPTDLSGNVFTTAIGVGAHQAHLQGRSHLTAPIACSTCHVVPTAVDSPGHLDSTGPAKVTASLGWDRTAQTCATATCHGPGRPVWTSTGQVSCGTCHGIPPNTPSHDPTMTLTSCASCHPGTVDAFGNIIITGGASEHINGVVDL